MAKINTTGERKAFERKIYQLVDDSYEGTITKVSDPITTKPFAEGEKSQTKVIIECTIPQGDRESAVLQLWTTLVVSKGGTTKSGETYSNSKLYDILDKANLIGELEKFVEVEGDDDGNLADEKLVSFMRSFLINRTGKIDVETRKRLDGERYSIARSIKRFTDIVENVKA